MAAEPQRQSAAATATPSVEGDTAAGRHGLPTPQRTSEEAFVRPNERTLPSTLDARCGVGRPCRSRCSPFVAGGGRRRAAVRMMAVGERGCLSRPGRPSPTIVQANRGRRPCSATAIPSTAAGWRPPTATDEARGAAGRARDRQ